MTELWHVSEDPTIEVFHPHHHELHELDEPLVWAVDSDYWWLYWFPRDCPRACFNATADTTEEDVERWLDGDPAGPQPPPAPRPPGQQPRPQRPSPPPPVENGHVDET